jgi:hypothetical protein
VVDPSGKVLTDAIIEVANEATGIQYSCTTNHDGIYTLSILPPGEYRIQASKPGFKTLIKAGIVLNVQTALALNFTLPLGATSETVRVDAAASLLNTSDGSVSTVIDRKFVQNIPLNGRSFQDLIALTPGVVSQSPQTSGQAVGAQGDFSVNGQRTETNYYMVDGVAANVSAGSGTGYAQNANGGAIAATTALGTTQSLIPVDALQEFRVESSSYAAQYGRSPGGQFALLSRSGTNLIHGSVYDYLRNNYFDANDWFNDHYGVPVSALRQNDFGGTVGGPVLLPKLYDGRDRTFFFVAYEGLRLQQPQAASVQYVPDTFLRENAPAPVNAILNAFPVQNGQDFGSLAEYIGGYSLPGRIDSTSVRLDHSFGPKLSVFFRFGDTPSSSATRNLAQLQAFNLDTQTYTWGATSQLSNRISNELRFGYARSQSTTTGTLDSFGGATPSNIAAEAGIGASASPSLYVLLYFAGGGSTYIQPISTGTSGYQWNLVDTLHYSVARHQLSAGIDYRRISSTLVPASPYMVVEYTDNPSILNNMMSYGYVSKDLGTTPQFNEFAAFAQDEWHVKDRLKLSYGLRWDVNPAPTEAHGNSPYTVLGSISNPASLTLAPKGTSLWITPWYSFAPRLGAAWSAHQAPGHETIVRAGGGLFFGNDNELATLGFNGIGFSAYNYIPGSALPLTAQQLNFEPSAKPPYTSSPAYVFPRRLQLPYDLQWNVAVQQSLGKEQAVTFSYVGSEGRRLLQQQYLSVEAVNPDFSIIRYLQSGVTSNYQSLQVQFQRSVSRGLQALASYTWSHSLDFGSTDASQPSVRGNSDFDLRNNFQAGASWDLPGSGHSTAIGYLLGGWGVDARFSARTAFPITLAGNSLIDPATGSQYTGNVDVVSGQPIYLYGSKYPGGKAINPQAFLLPPVGDAGDAPRNFVRGFGAVQANLAARRQFKISEDVALHFRAEAFNVTNHPNFGYVDPMLGDPTFGQATMMLNQSLGTMASQYQQGGPRSMQFALRLSF